MLLQLGDFSLLLAAGAVEFFQLAQLGLEHGRFDLGFFQRLVLAGGSCGWRCAGRAGLGGLQGLFGAGQLLLQLGDFSLLLAAGVVEFFQLAQLGLEHGGFDLGFFQRLVLAGRSSGWRCAGRAGLGGLQGLFGRLGRSA